MTEKKQTFVLKMTVAEARKAVLWLYDFEAMSGAGWKEELPDEAALIISLRESLEKQLPEE